jgi:sirohydrochlorin cobaltochelatase
MDGSRRTESGVAAALCHRTPKTSPAQLTAACHRLTPGQNFGVSPQDFSDAALVVVGHGTTLNSDSSAPVFQHAAELRRRRIFAVVREGFWKQEPLVVQALQELMLPRVFFVPLFISDGYFSGEVIPCALGFPANEQGQARILRRGDQTLFYCNPVGTHSKMTGVLLARARNVLEQFPFPRAPKPKDTTLFIAGHGTEQNDKSRQAVEEQVKLIQPMNIYAAVHSVFLDEEPRVPACYAMSQTKNIVIVPFFISEGLHVNEDIPVLLGEPERLVQQRLKNGQPTWRNPTEKQAKFVWYSPSAGTDPLVAEVVLERVREAAG